MSSRGAFRICPTVAVVLKRSNTWRLANAATADGWRVKRVELVSNPGTWTQTATQVGFSPALPDLARRGLPHCHPHAAALPVSRSASLLASMACTPSCCSGT